MIFMEEKIFLSFVYHIARELSPQEREKTYGNISHIVENESMFIQALKESSMFFEKVHYKTDLSQLLLTEYKKYIEKNILPLLDMIPVSFFMRTDEKKYEELKDIFSENTISSKIIRNVFVQSSYEEIQKFLKNIIVKISPKTNNVIIQSARECSGELKKEIRNNFGATSIVSFQVNKNLLGGVLVYQNGKLTDSTWLGKIQALKDL